MDILHRSPQHTNIPFFILSHLWNALPTYIEMELFNNLSIRWRAWVNHFFYHYVICSLSFKVIKRAHYILCKFLIWRMILQLPRSYIFSVYETEVKFLFNNTSNKIISIDAQWWFPIIVVKTLIATWYEKELCTGSRTFVLNISDINIPYIRHS